MKIINKVLLPDTTKEEWYGIRSRVKERIEETMGIFPLDAHADKVQYAEIEKYEKYELTHIRVRYHVIHNEWNEGIFVLPRQIENAAPAMLVIHGTNGTQGKYGCIDLENKPERAYGIELARRGYVCFVPDQFGFGATIKEMKQNELIEHFYEKYPEWSLDGRRLLEQRKALSLMSQMKFIKSDSIGAIGNSLGGRAVIYLMAFDERIKAAVCSTGISPNTTNIFRYIIKDKLASPRLSNILEKTGKAPWEYQEMIALCAPRALMVVEPFNDSPGLNPYVMASFECIYHAADVYKLLECPEKLTFLMHGDGHGIAPDFREFCYLWLDRFLRE